MSRRSYRRSRFYPGQPTLGQRVGAALAIMLGLTFSVVVLGLTSAHVYLMVAP